MRKILQDTLCSSLTASQKGEHNRSSREAETAILAAVVQATGMLMARCLRLRPERLCRVDPSPDLNVGRYFEIHQLHS